jgi:signal transduction histidine kinase
VPSSAFGWISRGADLHPGVGDACTRRSYSSWVASVQAVEAAAYRWMRPLAVVLVGSVITTAFQSHPGPGLHGTHLLVTLTLVGLTVGTFGAIRLINCEVAPQLGAMLLAVASAGVLLGVQPNGPGFLGMFPAVCGAALRLPTLLGGAVAVIAGTAAAIGWALSGHRPASGIVLNEFGIAAVYLLGSFARRLRHANAQAHDLIAELEASRAAQASAAALAERQRLAREMHDVLAHSLSGLVLNLEGARLLADRNETASEVRDAIQRSQRLAKSGLDEARRAIGMLRDDALPGPESLAALVAAFEGDGGAPCQFDVSGDPQTNGSVLGSDGQLTIYRVAQEALTNIRKHAHPDHVIMQLAYEPAGVRLIVEDCAESPRALPATGSGSASGNGSGYGLTGMRERAALLGGTLTAGQTRTGFRVELWVPA